MNKLYGNQPEEPKLKLLFGNLYEKVEAQPHNGHENLEFKHKWTVYLTIDDNKNLT